MIEGDGPSPRSQASRLFGEASTLTEAQQVTQLQNELQTAHAHYQKLLETVGGPSWKDDPGPLERSPNSIMRGRLAKRTVDRRSTASDLSSHQQRQDDAVTSPKLSSLAVSVHTGGSPVGSGPSSPDATAACHSPIPPATPAQSHEARAAWLERQVVSLTSALRSAEYAAATRTAEVEAVRDKMAAKEHAQFNEIKKLRAACAELRTAHQEEKVVLQSKMDAQAARAEEERARLARDADVLRAQLAQVTDSIGAMIQGRSSKADADRKLREAIESERDALARQQLAALSVEKDKQLENLKEQSAHFLARKSEEITALRGELQACRKAAAAEAEALQAEVELLAGYADKMTELMRRAEAGAFSGRDVPSIKALALPPRDRPAVLNSERLRYLATRNDLATVLLAEAASETQCPSPRTLLNGGTRLASSSSFRSSQTPSFASNVLPDAANRGGALPAPTPMFSASRHGSSPQLTGLESSLLRSQWEAEAKAAVTAQALVDLRSDNTVEYIRSLESQIARYRKDLQAEAKRGAQVTTALRSAQRSGRAALASSGSVDLGRALASRYQTARPACWGLGLRPGTASLPDGAMATTISLPIPGGSETHKSLPTTFASLTSGFRENGLSI